MSDQTLRDLNRRPISLENNQIREALPSYFQEEFPTLVKLFEYYFQYMDSDGVNNDHAFGRKIKDLHLSRDIGQTPQQNLTYIEDELLLGQNYLEGILDNRTGAELSNNFYRTKGTKYSIERFFRSFFATDPDVVYGKDLIFEISAPSTAHVQRFTITTGATLTETTSTVGRTRYYAYSGSLTVTLGGNEFTVPISIAASEAQRLSTTLTPNETRYYLTQGSYVKDGRTLWKTRVRPATGELWFESQYDGSQVNLFSIEGGAIGYNTYAQVVGKSGVGTPIGPASGKYILNDKIYQYWGILLKTDIAQSEWLELYKLFVHPGGMYVGSEVQIVSVNADISFDNMPISVPPPSIDPVFLSVATITTTPLTEASGIIPHSTTGDGKVRTNLTQYRIQDYTDSSYVSGDSDLFGSIGYQTAYYQSIKDLIQETSPTVDEDSDGVTETAMKMSNIQETMDQDEFFYYDSA